MTLITTFFAPKEKMEKTSKRQREEDANASSSHSKRSSNKRSSEVEELLAPLADSSWSTALAKHFDSSSFEKLAKFVAQERRSHTIFPPANDTFAALTLIPLDQVRVVIVGQDPYHGPGQAHGLCFSVLPGQVVPPSLKNIYAELKDDPAVDFANERPTHGHLSRWAKQGVLLLNTVLTVRKGDANSHKKRGWEAVTDELLRAVDRRGKGVVFLLWGIPATAKTKALLSSTNEHTVICTSHPSPLGARKTKQPFMGSRCFSRCNEALKTLGCEPIDWNVDGPLESPP
jgi:uracil-DNA glycosylase